MIFCYYSKNHIINLFHSPQVLQDKCLNHEKDEIHVIFKEEFNKSLNDCFSSFNDEPIAAASLAQVS